MNALSPHSFPHAILHIDGDSFFASCEVAKNPALRGKPVVTGKERGIASSMTYEAKAMGVTRAMKLSDIKKICPGVIILPSDYETYSLYSKRMFEIVRRYTEAVDEYSIDECFADLTGMRRPNNMSYEDMAIRIKHELDTELGMTFSLGLSVNKVLAKVGSKWRKPSGLTIIPGYNIHLYLAKLPVEKIWGIGPNTSAYIQKLLNPSQTVPQTLPGSLHVSLGHGPNSAEFFPSPRKFSAENLLPRPAVAFGEGGRMTSGNTNRLGQGFVSALDFAIKSKEWVKDHFTKPIQEIHRELNGDFVYPLTLGEKHDYSSISKTKTFTPPSMDREFVFSQLSKNVENACIKLRRHNLYSKRVAFFLKTQEFRYSGLEIKLAQAVSVPQAVLGAIREKFDLVYRHKVLYRATGIVLMDLDHENVETIDLFGQANRIDNSHKILKAMDDIDNRYGKHTVFLGSSWKAINEPSHKNDRADTSERSKNILKGESLRKHINIPYLGSTS